MGEVKVYQLNECDAVAAESLEEAKEYYAKVTGFETDELYPDYEVKEVSPEYMVWYDEKMDKKVPVKDIIAEYWKGKPFIALSSEF